MTVSGLYSVGDKVVYRRGSKEQDLGIVVQKQCSDKDVLVVYEGKVGLKKLRYYLSCFDDHESTRPKDLSLEWPEVKKHKRFKLNL